MSIIATPNQLHNFLMQQTTITQNVIATNQSDFLYNAIHFDQSTAMSREKVRKREGVRHSLFHSTNVAFAQTMKSAIFRAAIRKHTNINYFLSPNIRKWK